MEQIKEHLKLRKTNFVPRDENYRHKATENIYLISSDILQECLECRFAEISEL
jgi:hypothetical protein